MSFHVPYDLPEDAYNAKTGDEIDLSPNKDGGIIKKVLRGGEGNFRLNFNDKVSLRYTAYKGEIANEYIFDSSERDGRTFDFRLGKGKVIRGFELVILTMRKKEHAIIYLQPEYAYGRGGAPPKLPADTKVIFDVEILDTCEEDLSPGKDKTILKHILTRGKGFSIPNEGSLITIHIDGWHGDRQFENRDITFPYGEGLAAEYKIPKCVETLLRRFKVGETAELFFNSKHAYGEAGCPDFNIPPNADLKYIITMHEYERVKDVWEMDNQEKMDQCDRYKEKGTFYFKKDEYKLAKKFYKKMLENIEFDTCMEGEEEKRRCKLYVTGYLNLAFVYLKLEKYTKTISCCDKVLKEELNVKALYRRGQASFHLKSFQDAIEDFEGVLEIQPDNKTAKNFLQRCHTQLRKTEGQDRELAKRMLADIGKGKGTDLRYGSGMNDIGDWDNSMAHGMMTLEQECEAFGNRYQEQVEIIMGLDMKIEMFGSQLV